MNQLNKLCSKGSRRQLPSPLPALLPFPGLLFLASISSLAKNSPWDSEVRQHVGGEEMRLLPSSCGLLLSRFVLLPGPCPVLRQVQVSSPCGKFEGHQYIDFSLDVRSLCHFLDCGF